MEYILVRQVTRLSSHLLVSIASVCSGAQSCPALCGPMDCRLPGSSVHNIFQVRVLEWVAIWVAVGSLTQRDHLNAGIEPAPPVLWGELFTTEPPRKPLCQLLTDPNPTQIFPRISFLIPQSWFERPITGTGTYLKIKMDSQLAVLSYFPSSFLRLLECERPLACYSFGYIFLFLFCFLLDNFLDIYSLSC